MQAIAAPVACGFSGTVTHKSRQQAANWKTQRSNQERGATSSLCCGLWVVLSLSVGQRKLLRRAKSHDQEPKVDVNGTLLGDRPKVRYAWQIPQAAGPEIVLAGCSNAGKSTLLNAVLTSVGLTPTAPVSDKGGRTRTLNWYPYGFSGPIGWDRTGVRLGTNPFYDEEEQLTLNGRGCCIVDCFGLGRVDFSLPARRLQSWGPLLEGYIGRRRAVNTVCHLISSEQQGALSPGDEQLIDIWQACDRRRSRAGLEPLRFVPVLTKIDLLEGQLEETKKILQGCLEERGREAAQIVCCSSLEDSASGILEVQEVLEDAMARGWEALGSWQPEAFLAPQPPGGRTVQQKRQVRAMFVQTRKPAAWKPPQGGAGASTQAPPRV